METIRLLIDSNRFDEARRALDTIISSGDATAEAYYLRGRLFWRTGFRSLAVTDYEHAVALDPDSPARHALEMARDIESFFNPDLLNP